MVQINIFMGYRVTTSIFFQAQTVNKSELQIIDKNVKEL